MSVSDPLTRMEVAYDDQCVAFEEVHGGQGLALARPAFQKKEGEDTRSGCWTKGGLRAFAGTKSDACAGNS